MSDSPTDNQDDEKDTHVNSEESSASENQDAETAEDSSTSGDSESEETTLDAVNAALKGDSDEDDDTEGSSEDDSTEDKGESKDDSESKGDDSDDEITEDELKSMKTKTRKRFEQLQGRLRDTKTENQELREKLETSEVDAGHYRQLTDFLNNNGINQDEANTLFSIGAMMKNDPNQALQMITPYYNQLLELTGNVLPKDLQEQVQQGYITEQYAFELSQQRAANQNHQVQQRQQQQYRQRQDAQRQQQLNTDIQAALANLEKTWQSDPDYKMTSTRIRERVKLMWFEAAQSGKMPQSVDEAMRMVKEVKSEVERELKQFMPKPKSINPPPEGGNNPQSKPVPQNTLDVINQTVGG